MLGKFQGDSYEKLWLRATKSELLVRVDTGHLLSFDLTTDAHVYTDPGDATCFVLEIGDGDPNIVIFKVTRVGESLVFCL